MPILTLRPLSVAVSTTNTDMPPQIVGGDTGLSDDSDPTYADVWASTRVGRVFALSDRIHAHLPAVPDLLSLNSATISARLRYFQAGGAVDRRFHVYAARSLDPSSYIGSFEHAGLDGASTVPATDTTYTITDWTLYSNEGAPTDSVLTLLGSSLASGDAGLSVTPIWDSAFPTPGDWGVRVYELSMTIDYDRATLTPPCHLYPRDDDQGAGSSAIWPPPSSGGPGSYY